MIKNLSNIGKATIFTLIVLSISSIMGLVLHVSAPVYMLSPLITVLFMQVNNRGWF